MSMETRCHLCCLDFDTSKELEIHVLSLSHHIKLESSGVRIHHCNQCQFNCESVSEYSKHVNSEEHKKRKNRLLAIIDTEGDCEDICKVSEPTMYRGYDDRESQPFDRNDSRRMTCPSRMGHYPMQGPGYTPGPRKPLLVSPPEPPRRFTRYSAEFDESDDSTPPPRFSSFQRGTSGRHSYHPGTSSHNDNRNSSERRADDSRNSATRSTKESSKSSSHRVYTIEARNDDPNKSNSRSKKDGSKTPQTSESREKAPKAADEPKRGIMARLSMRKKTKPDETKKIEKPVSSIAAESTSTKRGSAEESSSGAATSPAKKKKTILPSAIQFGKKPFDLSNFMKRRSNDVRSQQTQRMQRERAQKFKLVDSSKGIEESEEDKTSPVRRNPSSNLPSSGIWGATPVVSKLVSTEFAQQRQSIPCDSPLQSLDETNFSSIYSLNTLDPGVIGQSAFTPPNAQNARHVSESYPSLSSTPGNSSLTNSMSVAGSSNNSARMLNVKAEPPSDSPPPVALPMPAFINQSFDSPGPSTVEIVSNAVQSDKLKELWDLTHCEEQNKIRINALSMELYQLQQEMHQIQMRKMELMGHRS